MTRGAAVLLTVALVVEAALPAARAFAQAAAPFPEVPLHHPPAHSRRLAYASMLVGLGAIGASFALEHEADHSYDLYLDATDPAEIDRLYGRARLADNLSATALIGGEALVAFGLYLRFLKHAPSDRVSLVLRPRSCALSFQF